MIFFLLIYSNFILCDTVNNNNDITVSHVDKFPHNIDQDFSFNVKHLEIKNHHLYAVFILHVKCALTSETQSLYIYPGFTTKLDHRLKETLFHTMSFHVSNFNTKIILRFYRNASECTFLVDYSAVGAEVVRVKTPPDLVHVYTSKIHLFRPAKLNLSIMAEDGHTKGLSIGKIGDITCRAIDSFPVCGPVLTIDKEMTTLKEQILIDDRASMRVIAALKDHGTLVKCTCGSVITSSRIIVFHHAQSVEIVPQNQQWFKQGSKLECKSIGGGYPKPVVRWTVVGLNETSRDYFSVSSSSETVSTIHISNATPNDTRWILNCSSSNIIPPLDWVGPSVIVNISIGENNAYSIMLSNYLWLIVVVSVIVFVVVVVGIICLNNHVRRSHHSRNISTAKKLRCEPQAPPEELKYSSVPSSDHEKSKDEDCFV